MRPEYRCLSQRSTLRQQSPLCMDMYISSTQQYSACHAIYHTNNFYAPMGLTPKMANSRLLASDPEFSFEGCFFRLSISMQDFYVVLDLCLRVQDYPSEMLKYRAFNENQLPQRGIDGDVFCAHLSSNEYHAASSSLSIYSSSSTLLLTSRRMCSIVTSYPLVLRGG